MNILQLQRISGVFSLVFALAVFCAFPISSLAAGQSTEAPSAKRLSSLMTPEEYAAAGLDKLNDSERAALDAWLTGYLSAQRVTQVPMASAQSDFFEKVAEPDRIEAKISGDFSGWTGETRFVLDNGQVWRQRMPGKFRYSGPQNPPVVISKNFLGLYVLTVDGVKRGIGVERVR